MADRDKQFRMQIMMDKQGNNYKTQYNNIGGKKNYEETTTMEQPVYKSTVNFKKRLPIIRTTCLTNPHIARLEEILYTSFAKRRQELIEKVYTRTYFITKALQPGKTRSV